jgi:precorrin-8X/cobalt-precorrin-8 methylmutase
MRPRLVIGVPVGFVNVVESKETLFSVCERSGVPAIIARGRKGGSSVAAAICNALLYAAAGMLDPSDRGWN